MGLAAALEVVADLHQENGVMLTADGILALLGGIIGPAILQLLSSDEVDVTIQLGMEAGESNLQCFIGLHHSAHDGDGAVLTLKIGLSAFLNGAGNALHVLIAGGSGKDVFGRLGGVEQREGGTREDDDQRDESHTYPRQVSKMWKKPEKPAGRRSCPLLPVIKERL